MIEGLPLELKLRLVELCPKSSIKFLNSHFYIIYNDLFYQKILHIFGDEIILILIKILPYLKSYIKSLDSLRYITRNIIASRLDLKDVDYSVDDEATHTLDCAFIKDSWKYIYSILKNRRLFAEYRDYEIDQPKNYVFNHYVEINRTYLLSYRKILWLAPGLYNLNIALVIRHGSGLGTTKFEVQYEDDNNEPVYQTFYPPTNIKDILPKEQFCMLKIGEFEVPHPTTSKESHNKLKRVSFIMEETGLYLKSGFKIFFIDISLPSLLFNQYNSLYYTMKETDYRYFINIPLKNLYKVLDYVQSGNSSAAGNSISYGTGKISDIEDHLEHTFTLMDANDNDNDNDNEIESIKLTDGILKYGDFFFNVNLHRRLFKFNTIYEKRMFINRFGDFELDWNESKGFNVNPKCKYDRDGMKWKIPILVELS